MRKRRVVHGNNLAVRMPVFQTITTWLALDHWSAPTWFYGASFTLLGIVWILAIVDMFVREAVDVFERKP